MVAVPLAGQVAAATAVGQAQIAERLGRGEVATATRLRYPVSNYLAVFTKAIDSHFQLLDVAMPTLDAMLQLNITAPTRLAHAASKAFAERGRGAIINIGSTAGIRPRPGLTWRGFCGQVVSSMVLDGNSYSLIGRGDSGARGR